MTIGDAALQLVAASAGVAVVLWVPGLVVVCVLGPGGARLRAFALAPAVSLGLLLTLGLALDAVGLPVRGAIILPVIAMAVGGLAWRVGGSRVGGRRVGGSRVGGRRVGGLLLGFWRVGFWRHWATAARRRPDLLALVLVMCVGVGLWMRASHLGVDVPAKDDGTHHGLFAERILRLGTVDPGVVGSGDVLGAGPRLSYYPLALHLAAALIAELTHVPVGTVIVVMVTSLAAVAMPAGVFVLTRRLFPADTTAAVGAAALSIAYPDFPYYVASWGGLTMIAGFAVLPSAVDALVGARDDGPPLRVGLVLGTALIGLFGLHNPEFVTAGILATLVLLGPPYGVGSMRRLADSARPWLIAIAAVLIVFVPQLSALRGGAAERDAVVDPRASALKALSDTARDFLGVRSFSLALATALVAVGLVVALRRRQAIGWIAGLVLFAALTYAADLRVPLAHALAVPWYSSFERVVINELVPVATLGGLGFSIASRWLPRLLRTVPPPTSISAAIFAWAALVLGPMYMGSSRQLVHSFAAASYAGPSEREAFSFLAGHQQPGERVLNDFPDGSGWMYTLDNVAPVFAMALYAFPDPAWGDRLYLLDHAAQIASDPRARCAADQWHVRYVYVGPRVFEYRKRRLDGDAIAKADGWHEVYDRDGARIFERTLSAGSPGCPAPAH